MAITYSVGNPIVVTGTVDMEDIYNAAYTNSWVDASGDPVVESPVEGQYFIRVPLEIGDGSTATTLTSLNEMVYFDDNVTWQVKDSATLNIGDKLDDWGRKGSMWNFGPSGTSMNPINSSGATLGIYASMLHVRTSCRLMFYSGTFEILNSILSGTFDDGGSWTKRVQFHVGTIKDVFLNNFDEGALFYTSQTIDDLHVHGGNYGIQSQGLIANNVVADNCRMTSQDAANAYTYNDGRSLTVKDPKTALSSVGNSHAANWIAEAYTFNLTVGDKDGTLTGMTATVTLDGSDSGTASTEYDTEAFSEDTTNGVLAEQTVTARKWVGTSETLTNYNKFRLTVEAAGYETLVLDNITVDSPIDWHLELQPPGGAGAKVKHIGIGVNI